jgi:Glutamate-cysteine ligase
VNLYISNDKRNFKRYNDLKGTINWRIKKFMLKKIKEMGLESDKQLDEKLVDHISTLFVRENLCVFKSSFGIENDKFTNHFESI